jgi:anti-sigma factor RsiW
MITCRDLSDLLPDLVDGELSAQQRELIRNHLRRCPSCVAYVESYQVTVWLARRLPPVPLPPATAQRLLSLCAAMSTQREIRSESPDAGYPPDSRGGIQQ